MKTTLALIALACAAVAVTAFTIPSTDGLVCNVVTTADGHAGPLETVRYSFLTGHKFKQDDSVAPMSITSTSYVLGEAVDGWNGFHSDAIVISRPSLDLHWSSRSGDRYVVTTGRCRMLGASK